MNLLRAASTVSLLTLASRITGLGRELVVASSFGVSAWTDAFNVAFRIPNLLRRLFAEGAFSQAFVPILAETRAREGDDTTRLLIDAVATVLVWVLLLASVIGVVAAPVIVWAMASGLERMDGAVVMTRWMFPYIGFMSLVALSAGILNTWRRFAVPAATPVLLNMSTIIAAWSLGPAFATRGIEPIYSLAVGVMLGGVLQLLVQIPALLNIGGLPRIGFSPGAVGRAWKHPGVHRVLRQMAPAVLGVSVAQLSLLVNTQIASHVGVGAVSWLTYADRLMEFPTALLGVALGVVLLPQLSAVQTKSDVHAYSALLDWGLRLVAMLALPCGVALLVFAKPLVSVLFHYGAFKPTDVDQTVLALMGYGVGLLGIVAVKVLAPGFYAQQNIRTPVKIAVAVLALTQLMNLAFVPWFAHAGLALSIGLGATINALWLFFGLRRKGMYVPGPGWGGFMGKVVIATVLLGAVLVGAAQYVDWIAMQARPGIRILLMAASLGGAGVVYFGALRLMGLRFKQFARLS
ncbi:murein biosynthesis integral membrane protein MurJ [soil metagenome]